jgi:PAS domain S-box-containing protein
VKPDFFREAGDEAQFLALFDMIPGVSFSAKDRKGKFVALNQRACEYCGVPSESEALGKTDYDFFPKPRADEYRADDEAVMKSGNAIVNRIESAPEPEGSPRLVMTSKIPIRDQKGKVIGTAGVSRQIELIRNQSATADAFSHVVEHLHSRYAEPLTSKELANIAGLSVSQFERRFRRAFGTTPRQYLMRVRVENAAKLLVESDQTVSRIAVQCGFYDHAHLSRHFRRFLNASPSEYRKKRMRV